MLSEELEALLVQADVGVDATVETLISGGKVDSGEAPAPASSGRAEGSTCRTAG